jgi:lipocalin
MAWIKERHKPETGRIGTMKISDKKSVYGGYGDHPDNIIIVSDEALREKRKNWHEIAGMGDGYAYVTHPDWKAIFTHRDQDYILIHVETESGKLAHVGSINRYQGKIELRG